MPHFSKSIKLQTFHGSQIPQSAPYAALGKKAGVYFFWKGVWNFMAMRGYYIVIGENLPDCHLGIERLK